MCSSEGTQPTDLLTPFKSMNTTTHGNNELLSEAVDQELTLDELQCVSGGWPLTIPPSWIPIWLVSKNSVLGCIPSVASPCMSLAWAG